eukprot:1945403-Amphidinium_carterae.3
MSMSRQALQRCMQNTRTKPPKNMGCCRTVWKDSCGRDWWCKVKCEWTSAFVPLVGEGDETW